MSTNSGSRLLSKLGFITATAGAAVAPVAAAPAVREAVTSDDDSDLEARGEDDAKPDGERSPIACCDDAIGPSHGVAFALTHMAQLAATELASTWALSLDARQRLVLASALGLNFPLVGDDIVIDHLHRDPDPAIRIAAARAAWGRRATLGDDSILQRLLTDPNGDVRQMALLATTGWTSHGTIGGRA